ncbi:DUF3574 domain-containing protein [Streptomyces piniterrae]|uniref:DUF3574 domain-containing protein n=1 Tax=Streptomyces piniterrae TaxID=2571125 RepID=A0A4U0NG37_9ACTN|nr:DUF3574 domain-containing protein [Streptomyces piniterrae]TJZ53115.1 DUF3574 domain-containing protein [Streptomyces piniterrae]
MAPSRLRIAVLALSTALLGAAAPASAPAVAPASAHASQPPRAAHGAPYVETSLFFGTARPDGGPAVTDKQFHAFVDKVVTPRFPDGLTIQEGQGQYRDAHGVIEHERSYELTLFYPTSQAGPNDPKIEYIRDTYNKRFGQESVARVDDRARVDF